MSIDLHINPPRYKIQKGPLHPPELNEKDAFHLIQQLNKLQIIAI